MSETVKMTAKDLEDTITSKIDKSLENFEERMKSIPETVDEKIKEALKPIEKRMGSFEVKEREVEGGGGFNSSNEYWKAAVTLVRSKGAVVDARFKAAGTGLVTAQGPDGGLMVPPAWSGELLSRLHEDPSNFAARCWNLPIGGNSLDLPMFNDTNRANGIAGGIVAYWTSELGEYTSSMTENAYISLKLSKLTALVYVSDEMVSDSAVSITPLISRAVNMAFVEKFNAAIIGGSGAKEPRGIMTDPAIVEVSIEDEQTADDPFVPMNIFKMRARCTNYSKAVWLAGPDALPYLATLAQPIGTGGQLMALFDGNNLYGRPVLFNDYMQAVNTAGDLMLVDFSDYIWATKAGQGVKADSSIHLKFDFGQEALRFSVRADGQGIRLAPFTPRNSGDTRSPFVRLGLRS